MLAGARLIRKPDYPRIGIGADVNSSNTAIPPSATANTKGAYTQLIASTAAPTKTALLSIMYNPAQATPGLAGLVDIAIGGAGSETVLIPNIQFGASGQFNLQCGEILLPITIPAGTRISARSQVNIASSTDSVQVKLTTFSGGGGAVGIDSLNANTATGMGSAVTPGNFSLSAYVQIVAATARPYKGLFFILDCQGASGLGNFSMNFLRLATGAAASEVPFIKSYYYSDFAGGFGNSISPYFPVYIPAGTRLSFASFGASTSNAEGLSAYGVY